jgi:hypothetical protein
MPEEVLAGCIALVMVLKAWAGQRACPAFGPAPTRRMIMKITIDLDATCINTIRGGEMLFEERRCGLMAT